MTEKRERSQKALKELRYIDSLDDKERADSLLLFMDEFSYDISIHNLDLELKQLKQLSELFYKNIMFLKRYRGEMKEEIDSHNKIKNFLRNQY